MDQPSIGALRVWHIPQMPGAPFYVSVDTPAEALKVIGVLADYDLFQLKNRIKPDYANASGLEQFLNCSSGKPEWVEWECEDAGLCIEDWTPPD